jgi:hypothetical protein
VPHGVSDSKLRLDSIPGYTRFHGGAAGRAHNEAGFRHFLRIELQRAGRSGHCLLLVLVGVRERTGKSVNLPHDAASQVFSALGSSVREIDFVGWFKEGRIAAAALVQRATPTADVRQHIASRIMKILERERVALDGVARVRVVPLRGRR